MISTKNYNLLPDSNTLKTICKAISVLDAIISQDWEYRYYSYNSKWDKDEECFQMRNGSGDEMHILFREDGCVINGFAHEYDQKDKGKLTQNLPTIFSEFIFGEPVKSIGTTFCLWTTEPKNSDGQHQTYLNWASEYFEESYQESGIPLDTVTKVYVGQTLTKEMVLSIVDDLEDWEKLKSDLTEINYPFDFK